MELVSTAERPVVNSGEANSGALLDRIWGCVTDISRWFDRWDDPYARGPGLYFVIKRESVAEFAEPMGANRWPVEECASVFAATDVFHDTARKVAVSCDGAVIVTNGGLIKAEMVRFKQLMSTERARIDDLPYAGWMGARHMSALETSTRPEVLAAITLSEEDGRVTVFSDGTFEASRPRVMAPV